MFAQKATPVSAIPDSISAACRALPTGTVSFAFTDIEGSTKRWDDDPAAMETALRRHDALLRAAITENGGAIFKTIGDAYCAAFARPEDAIAAMLAVQHALAAQDFSAVDGLRVRAAIHTGTADERDGDYFGPALNRVARLLAIGHGGQVLVSGVTSSLAAGALPADVTLRDLGEHRLRDLAAPEHVFSVLAPGLAADHPPLRSLDAHANNLPLSLSSFVGREREIAEITALLGAHRLVTLVGAGGIGKTRTSLQVAANLLDGSGDGVWFIEFAPLPSGEYIPAAIAHEFGIALGAQGDPLVQIVNAVGSKSALFLFDNCEHVIDAAARVATAMLRGCPNIVILASSRQGLNIAGEQTYRLPSLAVPESINGPPTLSSALRSPAVALFVERARAVDNRFELTEANCATIIDICRRLDGIALAIELAAARVKILGPRQLRDRLDERFRVLTSGNRDALPRQQTLRALIDWSHDLLDERERTIFRRLTIFVNGFTLEGAVAVAAADDVDEFDIIDVLTSLTDKSLMLADGMGDSVRYRMLESTRAYGLERLHAAGEFPALAARRATFLAGVATQALTHVTIAERLQALEIEIDDLRDVLKWALAEGHAIDLGASIALSLGYYWYTRLPHEGQRWLGLAQTALRDNADRVLRAKVAVAFAAMLPHGSFERLEATKNALEVARSSDDRGLLARVLCAYGEQVAPLHQPHEAQAAFDEALVHARATHSDMETARALAGLGWLALDRDDITAAREIGAETMALFERIHAIDGVAYVCLNLGEAEFLAGNTERAIELARRGRALFDELGNERSGANASDNLALYALAANRPDEARSHARGVLELLRTDRHPLYFTMAIEALAQVATLSGDVQRGALLQGFTDAVFTKLVHARNRSAQRGYQRHLDMLTAALGAEELGRIADAGSRLSEDLALAEALDV